MQKTDLWELTCHSENTAFLNLEVEKVWQLICWEGILFR